MKQILPYFLLAVALVLLFMMWQSNQELEKYRREDNRRAQETISRHEATIKSKDDRINEVEGKRIHARDSAKVAQNAAKREIEAYKKTIAKLRPLIQDKIDSFPDLREFVTAQDSVITKQDSLLRAKDLYCALQIKDFQEILGLHQQKFEAQAQISEAWMQMATKAQKEASKEKRRKNFFKVVSGVLVGGIVYMSLKE